MTAELRLLHQINLRDDAWGGMEKSFCRLMAATREDPELRNFVAENLRRPAPGVEEALRHLAAPAYHARAWRGVVVPKRPHVLRRWNKAAQARRWGVNRVLNWNQFGDAEPLRLARALGVPAIYWERGASWFDSRQAPDADFLRGYDLYLANTHACRQMLRHRGVGGEIRLCRPPVYVKPANRPPRRLPQDRPLRLGFVSRLRAFKGGVLALHTLALARRRGLELELWIAGDGRDEACLRREALRLGLTAPQVHFLGRVRDVEALLDDVDLLLHPALREPYGNSCAEALCAGLPVVTTCVDGLPEVVDDGVNGYCVVPTLPLSDYARFGGDASDVYPRVYRPDTESVAAPRVPDPGALADAVVAILGDVRRYAAFSAAALATYDARFSIGLHLQRLKQLLGACEVRPQPQPVPAAGVPATP